MFEMLTGFPIFYSSEENGSIETLRKILDFQASLDIALKEAGFVVMKRIALFEISQYNVV